MITAKANPGAETVCWRTAGAVERIFAIPKMRLEIVNKRWKRIDTVISLAGAGEDEDCRNQGSRNGQRRAPELGGIGEELEAALRDDDVCLCHDEVAARIVESIGSGNE